MTVQRMNNGRVQLGLKTQAQEGRGLHPVVPSMEGVKVAFGRDGVSGGLEGVGGAAAPKKIEGLGTAVEAGAAGDDDGWLFV